MPFVSDIAGPHRPVETWLPVVTGALRRTSTIDALLDSGQGSMMCDGSGRFSGGAWL